MTEPKPDMVNQPEHHGGDTPYETLKVLEAWLTPEQFIGCCRGQAIIYLRRADKKDATVEDLEKATFYINYEIMYRRRLAVGLAGNDRVVLVENVNSLSLEELLVHMEKTAASKARQRDFEQATMAVNKEPRND